MNLCDHTIQCNSRNSRYYWIAHSNLLLARWAYPSKISIISRWTHSCTYTLHPKQLLEAVSPAQRVSLIWIAIITLLQGKVFLLIASIILWMLRKKEIIIINIIFWMTEEQLIKLNRRVSNSDKAQVGKIITVDKADS